MNPKEISKADTQEPSSNLAPSTKYQITEHNITSNL